MNFNKPVTETVRQRFSCRTYQGSPIREEERRHLQNFMASLPSGPFGSRARFVLTAVTQETQDALRGLGTYGFIRGATAFIIGAIQRADKDLEDYGFLMECIILHATSLGLGTCWLGGSFTRSSFARRIGLIEEEIMPAVSAVGHIADTEQARGGFIRLYVKAHQRRPWERMFWDLHFDNPLTLEEAGDFATALEMVRLGPSASNKQPWQVVKEGKAWHFYLRRTAGYQNSLLSRVLNLVDLQRVDIGAAMCHFELTAAELGLKGRWVVKDPGIARPNDLTEYSASWVSA